MCDTNEPKPLPSHEPVNIYADNFGLGPGLSVSITHIDKGDVVVRCAYKGHLFQSYAPTSLDCALAAVSMLSRGFEAPRALFRRGVRADQTRSVADQVLSPLPDESRDH
jgi:hypothetical protein